MFVKEKDYTNYKKATVFDLESDGLLEEATKIYILGFKLAHRDKVDVFWGDTHEDRIKAMLKWHIDNNVPMACHNAKTFDIPLLEKIYDIDLSDLVVIDTLALSWYLNIDKEKHNLEALSYDYEVARKYQIDEGEWANLTKEQAINRVTADVEINAAIYEDFVERLENMYSLAKEQIDEGAVGGKRASENEEIYIDSLKGLPVEGHVARLLDYLSFKKDCQRLAEKTKWKVDVPYLQENIDDLEKLVLASAEKLESVMPPVPVYSHRKEPKEKFKKNGDKSKSGEKWDDLLERLKKGEKDKWGNDLVCVKKDGFISEITDYKSPNINSHIQVKDFLFSHGWVPESFKYEKDEEAIQQWYRDKPKKGAHHVEWNNWKMMKPEERAIPQVRVEGKEGKELCESVSKLAEQVPEIKYLEEYNVIKHRLDTMKGIMSRIDSEGRATATCHGYTNTLRLKHTAPLVNLPGANRAYAEPIRGCLIAPDGYISCGSDLSGLEDRIKHHFMIPHDPEYVKTMSADDYDPHLTVALKAGFITKKDMEDYKSDKLTGDEKVRVARARHVGKQTGYASVYGAGPAKIAQTAGIPLKQAEEAHKGYWELNWSVKTIAEEQIVITDLRGNDWLINPINGLLYSVRGEKDYFSTLVQGTGAFFFDMWLKGVLERQYKAWKNMTLSGQFHDEAVFIIKDRAKFRQILSKMLEDSLEEVNFTYKLRRSLSCETQFGKRYSEIH